MAWPVITEVTPTSVMRLANSVSISGLSITTSSTSLDIFNPASCNASTMPTAGEGGGGLGMGTSPYQIMFHRSDYWASADGGENFFHGTIKEVPSGAFDYVRTAGSRTEPSGVYVALMTAPADRMNTNGSDGTGRSSVKKAGDDGAHSNED